MWSTCGVPSPAFILLRVTKPVFFFFFSFCTKSRGRVQDCSPPIFPGFCWRLSTYVGKGWRAHCHCRGPEARGIIFLNILWPGFFVSHCFILGLALGGNGSMSMLCVDFWLINTGVTQSPCVISSIRNPRMILSMATQFLWSKIQNPIFKGGFWGPWGLEESVFKDYCRTRGEAVCNRSKNINRIESGKCGSSQM